MSEEIKPVVLEETADVAKQEQEVVEAPVVEEKPAVEEVPAVEEAPVVEEAPAVAEVVEEVKAAVVNYGEKSLAELSSLYRTTNHRLLSSIIKEMKRHESRH